MSKTHRIMLQLLCLPEETYERPEMAQGHFLYLLHSSFAQVATFGGFLNDRTAVHGTGTVTNSNTT